MANQFSTPTWTLKEIGRRYENSLRFVANMDRQYDDKFTVSGAKVGNTINYRLPPRFTVSDGSALDLQNLNDQTVPISLTNQKHVDFAWGTWAGTTEVEDVRNRYVQQAADALASVVDAHAFRAVYRDVANYIGVPGTAPTTTLAYLQAGRFITDESGQRPGRVAVLDPEQWVQISNTVTAMFNPQSQVSSTFKDGQVSGRALGIDEWHEDQNRPAFTTGAATVASTPTVNGANQTGSSIITQAWATSGVALKKGDVVTFAATYGVNRLSYESTGRLKRFVLTADVSADGAGAATLSISPSIVTSGPLQTVNASPANSAAVTYWNMAAGGTFAATVSPTGMIYLPWAFGFVTADLELPDGGANSTRINSKARGVALRMAKQYDIQTDQNITRIDTLIGAATLRPEWAVRVQG